MVHEMLNIVYEGGMQTQELTQELQLRMNELYERETPRWEPLEISALIADASHEAAVDARAKDIDFKVHDEAQGIKIHGIRREIARPFVQMIDNAIKYTPSGGNVTVTVRPDGEDHVLFSVKDTGIGIPPGEEEQVFSLCERCSNAKEFASGTGTGLYYDRITVMHHNGEMWVESAGAGQGSTFFIRLPIHREVAEKVAGD
jgi:signal transduction histidine kinase